jgi:hypothetical protein
LDKRSLPKAGNGARGFALFAYSISLGDGIGCLLQKKHFFFFKKQSFLRTLWVLTNLRFLSFYALAPFQKTFGFLIRCFFKKNVVFFDKTEGFLTKTNPRFLKALDSTFGAKKAKGVE